MRLPKSYNRVSCTVAVRDWMNSRDPKIRTAICPASDCNQADSSRVKECARLWHSSSTPETCSPINRGRLICERMPSRRTHSPRAESASAFSTQTIFRD